MPAMARTGRRRAEVRRSRAPLLLALVALLGIGVTVAATAVVGPLGPTDGQSASPPATSDTASDATGDPAPALTSGSGSPTPRATTPPEVDLGNIAVPRTLEDCSALEGDAVAEALGAPVTLRQGYRSGDRVEVSPGVSDVVAEDACVFRSPRADARVWVFSAPVGTAFARALVRQARQAPGCTAQADETGFGDPTLTDVCTGGPGGRSEETTATLRGLFGDAWLTCSLAVEDESRDEVLDRARRWCTEVATVLAADS